jgi:3-hydroxyisobutyrate dehydrogenase
MGGGIARSLLRSGFAVAVRDIVPEAAAAFTDTATICASAAEVAQRCDVVLIVVLDADQVRDVLFGAGGLLEGARPGLLVGVVSTVAVSVVHEVVDQAAAAGVTVVDAGVTGGVRGAEEGTLVTLVGAADDDFARLEPVAEGFSSLVLHMGPIGTGMATKLARNAITYATFRAAYEAGMLVERAGLDLGKLVQAIRHSEAQFGGAGAQLAGRGTVAPMDPADQRRAAAAHLVMLAHKDLQGAMALADDLGVDVPVIRVTEANSDAMFGIPPA